MDILKTIIFAVIATVIVGVLFASFVTIGLAALGFAVFATIALMMYQFVLRVRHKRNMTTSKVYVYSRT